MKLLQLLMAWYFDHLLLLLYIPHMCGWPSLGTFQCNLVCENWSTGCGDISWMKFGTDFYLQMVWNGWGAQWNGETSQAVFAGEGWMPSIYVNIDVYLHIRRNTSYYKVCSRYGSKRTVFIHNFSYKHYHTR